MKYAIIVAAGSGKRFGGDMPKQFALLNDKPLLMHTIEAFSHMDEIVVVLSEAYIEYWEGLCKKHDFKTPHRVVTGGAQRFHSVKNALALIPDDAIVAIHDGVRPFVTRAVIDEAFAVAADKGAAVPVVDCPDSVRIISEDETGSAPFDRSRVKLVQTPQVFQASIIKSSYSREYSSLFTDDASVVESAGFKVTLTQGDACNKKITLKSDL